MQWGISDDGEKIEERMEEKNVRDNHDEDIT